jgi:TLP18.3/Psb32/MOLO-1 phosphatase superfamily protein
MKITERILILFIVLSLGLKFALLPGGNPLFVLTMMSLSCLYFVMSFALLNGIRLRHVFTGESYKGISAMKIVGAALTGIILSMLCIGITFKMMYWPGSGPMLIVGVIPAIIIIILSVIKYIMTKHPFYIRVLIRCGILTTFTIVLLMISGLTILKLQYRDHPAYIKAYEDHIRDPDNEELYNKMELEQQRATMSPEDFKIYEEHIKHQAQEEVTEEPALVNRKRQFPSSAGWTNDWEGLLKPEEVKHLDSMITGFTAKTRISIHLVTVDTIAKYDSSANAEYNLMHEWMASDEEMIVLIVVSKAVHSTCVTSENISDAVFPKEQKQEILKRSLIPNINEGNYFKALKTATINIMKALDADVKNN